MFKPPWLSREPHTISPEDSAFTAIYFTGNNKTYSGLHVRHLTILPDFNKIWVFLTDFHKSPQYQLSWNSVQ